MSPLTILIIAIVIGVSWQLLSNSITSRNINLLFQRITSSSSSSSSKKKSIVFIFAHPDDEAMFFTPILHAVNEYKKLEKQMVPKSSTETKVHFLCVSQGNYDKLGDVREKEMHNSALFYNVDSCQVFNHPKCLDGPKAEWDLEWVSKEIVQKKAIDQLEADVIFTFDDFGVSGHTNHRQVYQAVKLASLTLKSNNKPIFYKLVSLPIWRKYASIFGVILRNVYQQHFLSVVGANNDKNTNSSMMTVMVPPSEGLLSMRGLWNHRSQFVWFRFFYVLLASYSYENILEEF